TELARSNALFLVALLSAAAWGLLVLAWEPLGYYWALDHVPLLAAAGVLLRARPGAFSRARLTAGALGLALVPLVHVSAHRQRDLDDAVNTPEPLMASLRAGLGPEDRFIVLGRDWFGGIDFDLLFECLDAADDDHGRAVLHDYVMEPGGAESWRRALRE